MVGHRKYLDAEELGLEVVPNGEEQLIGVQSEELDPVAREKGHQMGDRSPRSVQRFLIEAKAQMQTTEERQYSA